MKNFNTKRFLRLTKWNFVCNWKAWFKFYVIWTIVWFFVFAINTLAYIGLPMERIETGMGVAGSSLFIGLFITCVTVTPSLLFSSLKTKQKRIEFFMLPATNIEKYVSSFVTTNIGMIGITMLGSLTADVLRFLFRAAMGSYSSTMVITKAYEAFANANFIFSDTEMSQATTDWMMVLVVSFIVVSYSFYLLGGTIFRKNHWLMTSIAAVLVIYASFLGIDRLSSNFDIDTDEEMQLFCQIVAAINTALSIAFVWASYKVFTRMQVINNKWTNL